MKTNKKISFFTILITTLIIILSTLIIFSLKKNIIKNNTSTNSCIKGGCSGQLCIDKNSENIASTCEWNEVYKCYKLAVCERQINGNCAFTTNTEFEKCLNENKASFKLIY